MRFPRPAAVVVTSAILAAGCGASSSSSAVARPASQAQLQILSPTPDQVTGPDVHLEFRLDGATVVPPTQVSGPLRGDQGHIHVSIDGHLVSMAYGTTQDLHGVTPGKHALQAEFVAVDHRPFSGRVVAAVLFQVQ